MNTKNALKPASEPDPATRIGALEDEIKRRDERIHELKCELDEVIALIGALREHVEDADAVIDSWIEVFEMEQPEPGLWRWTQNTVEELEWEYKFHNLTDDFNRYVGKYNALLALVEGKRRDGTLAKREAGRQIKATPEQRQRVFELHDEGTSLRAIAQEVGLGLQTVRTLIDKITGRDRINRCSWREVMPRLPVDKAGKARTRARKRARDALPKRIGATLKAGRELVKRAKGLK